MAYAMTQDPNLCPFAGSLTVTERIALPLFTKVAVNVPFMAVVVLIQEQLLTF